MGTLHSGQEDCSWSQLTRQRKSKVRWLQGEATARSVMGQRQITQAS